MTGRGPAAPLLRATRFVAGALLMACLVLPLDPQPASACDVSYGYKPSLSIGEPGLGQAKPCSNGTSLTGAFLIAVLAIGALGAAGTVAVKRAAARTASGPDQALAAYLHATGIERATDE